MGREERFEKRDALPRALVARFARTVVVVHVVEHVEERPQAPRERDIRGRFARGGGCGGVVTRLAVSFL